MASWTNVAAPGADGHETQDTGDEAPQDSATVQETAGDPTAAHWLDRARGGLHEGIWRSARAVDAWAGPPLEDDVYQQASGRVALAMLWDEHDGFDPKLRFRLDAPLPQINRRLNLFIGRFNRDEYVTERNEPSGAFPFARGLEEDETLAGFAYSRDKGSGDFSASAGVRIRSSDLDPYVKAGYRYRWLLGRRAAFTVKETLFYQMSENFGLTSRLDYEWMPADKWYLRWTGSGTVSQGREGVRGYSTLTAVRALPGNRSISARAGMDADSAAPAPLRDFDLKVAYRRPVFREWLVLELRVGVSWPKTDRDAPRKPSWGVGIGWEMTFGSEPVSVMPVTF